MHYPILGKLRPELEESTAYYEEGMPPVYGDAAEPKQEVKNTKKKKPVETEEVE